MVSYLSIASLFLFCLSSMLLVSPVQAWWCYGHMLVAEIAKRHLDTNVATLMEKMAAKHSASGPFPMSPDFVQLACWSDDLKSYGLRAMEEWHFVDTPYNPENVTISKCSGGRENVLTMIESLVRTLKDDNTPRYVANFALGNLIHFYGDIHQPLHAAEYFSSLFPMGDKGGNMEKVRFNTTEMSLHAFWDSICQGEENDFKRPLQESDYSQVRQFADYLEETNTFTDKEISETRASEMAKESFEYAERFAYAGVGKLMDLSEEYIQNCKKTAEARVALAGRRLAFQLNLIFAEKEYLSKKLISNWHQSVHSIMQVHKRAKSKLRQFKREFTKKLK